jgi:serine-type D-Ala-D-Ala carboxypeptidase (penicillin-binding protein 5/6)
MKNYLHIDSRNDIIDCTLLEFYAEMNIAAAKMKLRDTHFLSAHGMHHDKNYSSAYDISVISYHCMKNWKFQNIVKT